MQVLTRQPDTTRVQLHPQDLSEPHPHGPTSYGLEVPNGAPAAAMIAAAIGVVALGLIDVLAKTVTPFDALLSWYPPTGDLSGITSLSVLVWLVVWAGLSRAWRTRSVDSGRVLAATLVLIAIGVILTFPPTAQLVPW
jgi:hypothetical protein